MMSKVNEADVRAEVRTWLAANWDPEMSLVAWRNKLVDSGWGMPQWPEAWYGRGLPLRLVRAVEEEFASIGAVGVARSGVRLTSACPIPSTTKATPSAARSRPGRPATSDVSSPPSSSPPPIAP